MLVLSPVAPVADRVPSNARRRGGAGGCVAVSGMSGWRADFRITTNRASKIRRTDQLEDGGGGTPADLLGADDGEDGEREEGGGGGGTEHVYRTAA